MRVAAVIPVLISLHVGALAQSTGAPAFDQYSVQNVYHGRTVMPDFARRDRSFAMFRTRIRTGMAGSATFAGHFGIIQFGCGTGCNVVFVADLKTGRVDNFPRGGEDDQSLQLDFRPSSSLVRALWRAGFDRNSSCMQEEFVMRRGRLESLAGASPVQCLQGYGE